jgi:hypothetical protein
LYYTDTRDRPLKPLPNTKMATKKTPKKQSELGPLEKALKAQDNADRAADRAAKLSEKKKNEPLTFSLPEAPDPFYTQQLKHKYGTCWQCGDPRNHAGGLPGGSDAYWCDRCKDWLPVRECRSDPAKVSIQVGKSRV